jgi:hypothetical protein
MEPRYDDTSLKGEGRLTDDVLREKLRRMRPLFGGRRQETPKSRPAAVRGSARPR